MIQTLAQIHARAAGVALALPAWDQALWRDLRRASATYAPLRLEWRLAEPGERGEIDGRRSGAHEVVIDACNALSRRCGVHGLDQTWRAELGDASTAEGRKRIGDFACYVAFVMALEAR